MDISQATALFLPLLPYNLVSLARVHALLFYDTIYCSTMTSSSPSETAFGCVVWHSGQEDYELAAKFCQQIHPLTEHCAVWQSLQSMNTRLSRRISRSYMLQFSSPRTLPRESCPWIPHCESCAASANTGFKLVNSSQLPAWSFIFLGVEMNTTMRAKLSIARLDVLISLHLPAPHPVQHKRRMLTTPPLLQSDLTCWKTPCALLMGVPHGRVRCRCISL